jgi:hypothetical protein
MIFSKKNDTYYRKYVMKSIQTNINSPKGSDKGNIENKLYYIYYWQRGPGGSMSYVVGLLSNSYKPITNTAWVRARLCTLQKGCTWLAAASDKAYQLLAHGRWFSINQSILLTTLEQLDSIFLVSNIRDMT